MAQTSDAEQEAAERDVVAHLTRQGVRAVKPTVTPLRYYDFFAGGGMVKAALADWTCLLANDIDARKGAAYAANWGAQALLVDDIARLKLSDLPGAAALAWASFPCQDISEAGKRAGLKGKRSVALWPCLDLMKALRAERRQPPLIVLENVPDLLAPSHSGFFDTIINRLDDMGYRFGVVMIDAALFVPQSRERVFIVAVDAALTIPAGLTLDRPRATFHPRALIAACERQRSTPIWWRLPIPPARNTILADILEDDPSGVSWNTQAYTDDLLNLMDPTNLAKVDAAKRAGDRMVGALYRRTRGSKAAGNKTQRAEVRFDGLAGCLRTPAGGSSRQTTVIVEGASVRSRLLSPREAARLMGLPDDYGLPANTNEALHLIGDGVAAPTVRFLAEHILEPILQAAANLFGTAP